MRVLHFVSTLGMGGAERQLYLLCRETNGQIDHRVAAVSSEGRWARPLRELGVPVRCLGSALRDPRLVWRMRSEVVRSEPDVVHCWLPSMNVAGTLAAGSTPMIASVRNVDDWKPWLYRVVDRALAPFWSAVIANSHAGAAEVARTTGIAVDTVHVVPNGIAPRPAAPKPPDARQVAIAACRLVAHKRVDRILEVAALLPEFRFRIAGSGPERAALEAAAPTNVEFLGELADPGAAYDAAGFFMLASEREGTSNALLEAMQAGCVPIVTPAGDNARIVRNGWSGRLAAGAAEMAAAARECLSNWTSMSEAARECAASYTAPVMAQQTLGVYRSLTHATVAHPLPRLH
jgi:glycosyltransferase involved in cell wall biosynthesis